MVNASAPMPAREVPTTVTRAWTYALGMRMAGCSRRPEDRAIATVVLTFFLLAVACGTAPTDLQTDTGADAAGSTRCGAGAGPAEESGPDTSSVAGVRPGSVPPATASPTGRPSCAPVGTTPGGTTPGVTDTSAPRRGRAVPNDYTGDGVADVVHVDDEDRWFRIGADARLYAGRPMGKWVAGDFDGDGVWEPAELVGRDWFSASVPDPVHFDPEGFPNGPVPYPEWTTAQGPADGAYPVPGDYDGTGRTVPAYYSLIDGTWWIMGHHEPVQFGAAPTKTGSIEYDVPVPADYDGDGMTDLAVYRAGDGAFRIRPSSGGDDYTVTVGPSPAIPVPADYDGDGRADPAVASIDGLEWFRSGRDGPFATFTKDPLRSDVVPEPADYDGDGRADAALLHMDEPSTLESQALGVVPLSAASTVYSTALPAAVLESVARLSLAWHCRHDENFQFNEPEHCPPR